MKGILVHILKSGANCSNNGISNRFDQALLAVEGGHTELFVDGQPANPDMPILMLDTVSPTGGNTPYARAYPIYDPHAEDADLREQAVGPMAGGCYIVSSDSRFGEAAGFYGAVALHDRYESQELYDLMTR